MPDLIQSPDGLPRSSAELVLFRIHVQAMIAVLGRKKAERYLMLMRDALAGEENLTSVFAIRPASEQAQVRKSRLEASAIFQRMLPIFLAALPPR